MANLFKKLFYTPNYISMPATGIAVSNGSIRYMELQNKGGFTSIKNFGEVSLEKNIIKDGEILNKDAFQKALLYIKTKISSDFVRVSIPEEATYVFDTQIPNIKVSEIKNALEFKLEENVPLKSDEVFFEYEILKNNKITPPKNTDNITVSVSAIPKKIVTSFSDAFEEASLYPVSFEIESRMTAKALIAKRDTRSFLIVQIKEDSTIMSLVVAGSVRFTSTVQVGDSNFKEILKKDYSSKVDNKLVIKDSYSLVNIFSIMKDEIEKFYQYSISKSADKKNNLPKEIDQIILCGKSATLPGFVSHIAQNIDVEVVLGNVWTNVFNTNNYLPNIKFEDSLNYATAIGLALPNNKK